MRRFRALAVVKSREEKAKTNAQHARRWLDRAIKDFALFRKVVPFDKKTSRPVKCSDPALAVYLLQQSIEKAVKAAAIASGQYRTRDFRSYFRHNSLALIIDLNTKIVSRIQDLGLAPVVQLMGIDLTDGGSKLTTLGNQIMGSIPLLDKQGKKVDFRIESRRVKPEVIDKLLGMVTMHRTLLLNVIGITFSSLPKDIRRGHIECDDAQGLVSQLSHLIAAQLNVQPPSEDQVRAPLALVKAMSNLGSSTTDKPNRRDITAGHLGTWAFSHALLWLSYLTFAHEETARYPLERRGDIKTGEIGCDDYDDSLGIVDCISSIGYVTNLTLNDMRTQIDGLALFFAIDLQSSQ